MSDKYSAKGTVLQLSIATVFTTVAGVSRVNYPDQDVQFYDATALDSGVSMEDGEPTGHVAPGSMDGEGFYDPADTVHQALVALLAAPSKESWKIINANITDHSCAFTGTLKKFTPTAAVGDGLKFNFEVKLASIATYSEP